VKVKLRFSDLMESMVILGVTYLIRLTKCQVSPFLEGIILTPCKNTIYLIVTGNFDWQLIMSFQKKK
jgi:hypothetical protein